MVRASSRRTHTDPKAEFGAIAVAFAAYEARQNEDVDSNRWLSKVVDAVGEEGMELIDLLRQAIESVSAGQSTKQFAESLGLGRGVSGYTCDTVPVAIHAWLSSPRDFRRAVTIIIESLGTTLAASMSETSTLKAPRVNPIAILLRNILFLFVVLCHGFRRIAPPY
jgi:ADP-ribosylglycohydrolase